MNEKAATAATITLLFLGLLMILTGIILPVVVKSTQDRTIQDIWLKPDDVDTWGEVPGDGDIRLIRGFKLMNYSNPDGILNAGEVPKVAEVYSVDYQEHQSYEDWYYTNETNYNFTQTIPSDFIAYHLNQYFERVSAISGQDLPLDTPITTLNNIVLNFFYALTHSPPPLFLIPLLLDIHLAMTEDFYEMIIAYSIAAANFTDAEAAYENLKALGLSEADSFRVIADLTYGWGLENWKNFRMWVHAVLEKQAGGSVTDGACDVLANYFGIPHFEVLFSNESLIVQAVEDVQRDMLLRYGTNNATELGFLQWGSGAVTLNLPFNLGTLPPMGPVPFPSFIAINQTFTSVPEPFFIGLALNLPVDLTQFGGELLEFSPDYPKPARSLLNLNSMGAFFSSYLGQNFTFIKEFYGLNKDEATVMFAYLGSQLLLPGSNSSTFDGYAMMLSRWTQNSLVRETTRLRRDVAWGFPAAMLLCQWQQQNITCEAVFIDTGVSSAEAQQVCSGPHGWSGFADRHVLALWAEASQKDSTSQSYSTLKSESGLDEAALDKVLYVGKNNLKTQTQGMRAVLAEIHDCPQYCSYEALFAKQWGSSLLTLNLPDVLTSCVAPTESLADWPGSQYAVPIEWSVYSEDIRLAEGLVSIYFSYDTFLNPTPIRLLYEGYLSGDWEQTAKTLHLPNSKDVEAFYHYFFSIIPGLTFFSTRTVGEWLDGYLDPFLNFIGNTLPFEQGGYPLVAGLAFNRIVGSTNDQEWMPYSVIYSGLGHPSKVTTYFRYYGEEFIGGYGPAYDPSRAPPIRYETSKLWDTDIRYAGGEGGVFGIYIDKDEEIFVFVTDLHRNANLSYSKTLDYKDVECYKYTLNLDMLKTSAYVPINERWNQFPEGFNGFLNNSNQAGASSFVGCPRCLFCEEDAQQLVQYYAYDQAKPFSERIYPDEHSGLTFGTIEPLSGAAVQTVINLQLYTTLYPDRFFKNIREPIPGKGLYLPWYQLRRSQNYTQSMIDDRFGALKFAKTLRRLSFSLGVGVGCFFIILAVLIVAYRYRIRRFGGLTSHGPSKEIKRAFSGEHNELEVSH